MACRLSDDKPIFEPMLGYCQIDPKEQTWNLNRDANLFIHENAFENVVCGHFDSGEMR